jgi:hypothetical protein
MENYPWSPEVLSMVEAPFSFSANQVVVAAWRSASWWLPDPGRYMVSHGSHPTAQEWTTTGMNRSLASIIFRFELLKPPLGDLWIPCLTTFVFCGGYQRVTPDLSTWARYFCVGLPVGCAGDVDAKGQCSAPQGRLGPGFQGRCQVTRCDVVLPHKISTPFAMGHDPLRIWDATIAVPILIALHPCFVKSRRQLLIR